MEQKYIDSLMALCVNENVYFEKADIGLYLYDETE